MTFAARPSVNVEAPPVLATAGEPVGLRPRGAGIDK
jgi:hypothetical protein